MASDLSYLNGVPPRIAEIVTGMSELFGDKVLVVIDRANITEAANDTWSYEIPFRLVGETSGLVLPFTGNVGAAITNTVGSSHSPTVSSATPSVVLGRGKVTAAHGGTSYVATDKQTVTITYTNMQGGTDTDTWTITHS